MSTSADDDDLQQGLAGALLASGQSNPFPGLALSLLGNPGQPQAPGIPISLGQGLTLGLPATGGPAPGAQGLPALPPVPATSADDAPVATPDTGGTTAASGGQAAPAYDVDKAVEYLDQNATPSYSKEKNGHCATAVREAIAAGGRQVENTPSAKDYGPKLVNAGFTHLDGGALKTYTPRKGDVIVIPAVGTHTDGHMEMYDGKHWVSDFMQHSQFPLKGVTNPTPYDVYRP